MTSTLTGKIFGRYIYIYLKKMHLLRGRGLGGTVRYPVAKLVWTQSTRGAAMGAPRPRRINNLKLKSLLLFENQQFGELKNVFANGICDLGAPANYRAIPYTYDHDCQRPFVIQ